VKVACKHLAPWCTLTLSQWSPLSGHHPAQPLVPQQQPSAGSGVPFQLCCRASLWASVLDDCSVQHRVQGSLQPLGQQHGHHSAQVGSQQLQRALLHGRCTAPLQATAAHTPLHTTTCCCSQDGCAAACAAYF
jgi:hypothetical protein